MPTLNILLLSRGVTFKYQYLKRLFTSYTGPRALTKGEIQKNMCKWYKSFLNIASGKDSAFCSLLSSTLPCILTDLPAWGDAQ